MLEKLPACGRCQKLLKRCEPCATRCNCSKVTNLLTQLKSKAQFKVPNIGNVVVAYVVEVVGNVVQLTPTKAAGTTALADGSDAAKAAAEKEN